MSQGCTRRAFVEGAALGAAGLAGLAYAGVGTARAEEAEEAEEPAEDGAAAGYVPGTYIGTAQGNSGTVVVEAVLGEGPSIESVRVLDHTETDHLMAEVAAILPQRIVDAQGLDVDVVSGATVTSFAVINAAADCMEQAGTERSAFASVSPEPTDETVSCQALVVGTGAAGLVAGLVLKSRGVDVLLVDQQGFPGGATRMSHGRMFAAMEESDIDRIREEFLSQTTVGERAYDEAAFPDMEKVEQYVTVGCETVNFLKDDCGLPLEYYGWVEGNERSTYDVEATKVHMGANDYEAVSASKGFQLVQGLVDAYTGMGGALRLEVLAEEILVDDAGAVTGVRASTPTGTLVIEAPYVVIATGSAGANQEMQATYCPEKADGEARTIGKGSDGSGIRMMVDRGAKVLPDWINSAAKFTTHPELACTNAGESFDASFVNTIADKTTLYVNSAGERIADESNAFVSLMFYRAGEIDCLYTVMDVSHAEGRGLIGTLEAGVAAQPDHFFKAGSIEELGAACGFDPAVFAETVSTYNGYCASGVDEEHGKAAENLVAIENGPFYAVRELLVNRDIAGGVYTDLDRRVLDEQDAPIPGLYSAGFASSRDLYGNGIPGAGSVGQAAVSGYIAGTAIAGELGA